ncbi:MAG TPA: DinB family protein [Candidatus Dormibacteraeota bacterium]|nr:DinB family protein [Candidatus Dormibacteraeota bacterium]
MNGKALLELQLAGSFNIVGDRLATVTDQEWIAREIRGTSLPGFTFWHAARIIDWGIHCAIQGVPEVADRTEWSGLRATELAYGAGISQAEADSVAHSVDRTDVAGYIAEVRQAALGWLRDLSDQDLDRVPDLEAHQRVKPRYLTPEVWSEVSDLAGLPTWQILARPCISHIRVHAGEIDVVLQSLRAKKSE